MATWTSNSFGGGKDVATPALIRRTFDLGKASGNTTGVVSGDTFVIDEAPANTKVLFHRVVNRTALTTGTSAAIYIGDATVTSRFVSNSNTAGAAAVHTLVSGADTTGTVYTAATPIILTLIRSSGTVAQGRIDLTYEFIDLNPVAGPTSF